MTARIPSSVRPPLHGSATGDDGRGGSGGLTYGVDGDGWTSSPSLPLPPASLTRPATAAQMVSGMKSWSVAFFIKSTKKLCAVMLDTVSPELQVVNKSEAAISVEANGCETSCYNICGAILVHWQ